MDAGAECPQYSCNSAARSPLFCQYSAMSWAEFDEVRMSWIACPNHTSVGMAWKAKSQTIQKTLHQPFKLEGHCATRGLLGFQSANCKTSHQIWNCKKRKQSHEEETLPNVRASFLNAPLRLPQIQGLPLWSKRYTAHRKLQLSQKKMKQTTFSWTPYVPIMKFDKVTLSTVNSKIFGRHARHSCFETHRLNTRSEAHPWADSSISPRSNMLGLGCAGVRSKEIVLNLEVGSWNQDWF